MRHFLNVLGNWFLHVSPLLFSAAFVGGLFWGACYIIDNYGY